jgi:ABC-type multidrug transport system ATPase subunit
MQECEALCTRLAIMVNGRFQCFGSLQHLKSKFGRGVSLTVRLKAEQASALRSFVAAHFPQHVVKDQHLGQVSFDLTGNYGWPYIFGTLEQARAQFGIEDYSVSQTTLEQVFVEMVRDQAVEDEPDAPPES